ncbi:hypothetical protein ZIOFF_007792 [Zingiber officinale]|uniref:Uncharacterized protein n=1 Tax=Zingiber officinale TaxID=94328 RepID=A0A8J5IH37_ZINOF|nr:hypothetical protein ZIOFF_007792 [Zingiber officinale]
MREQKKDHARTEEGSYCRENGEKRRKNHLVFEPKKVHIVEKMAPTSPSVFELTPTVWFLGFHESPKFPFSTKKVGNDLEPKSSAEELDNRVLELGFGGSQLPIMQLSFSISTIIYSAFILIQLKLGRRGGCSDRVVQIMGRRRSFLSLFGFKREHNHGGEEEPPRPRKVRPSDDEEEDNEYRHWYVEPDVDRKAKEFIDRVRKQLKAPTQG